MPPQPEYVQRYAHARASPVPPGKATDEQLTGITIPFPLVSSPARPRATDGRELSARGGRLILVPLLRPRAGAAPGAPYERVILYSSAELSRGATLGSTAVPSSESLVPRTTGSAGTCRARPAQRASARAAAAQAIWALLILLRQHGACSSPEPRVIRCHYAVPVPCNLDD